MPNKTVATDTPFATFLETVSDTARRDEARALADLFHSLTGEPPVLWGTSIVGFGSYRYRYESGREGDMCRIGFSPRKADLVIYLVGGFQRHESILARLGRHKTGRSCLYLKHLSDVETGALADLVTAELAYMDATYPRG